MKVSEKISRNSKTQNHLPVRDRDLDPATTNPFKAASTLPLNLALCLQVFLSR